MSIEKQHKMYIFICDECDADYDTMEEDFNDALQMIKEDGWTVTKDDDDEWIHICEKCNP